MKLARPRLTTCVKLIACIFLFLPVHFLRAQELQFTALTNRDGLPSLECYNMLQDKHGYIWVFTEYGIVKHNGQSFIPVCTNIPVKDQNAYAIFQSPQGDIYFANSSAKIFKVKNDLAYSIKPIEVFTRNFNKPKDIIHQVIADTDGTIYFSTYENTFRFNPVTKKIETIPLPPNTGTPELHYQYVNGKFFATRNFATQVRELKVTIKFKETLRQNLIVDSLSFYKTTEILHIGNAYYVATDNKVYRITPNEVTSSNYHGDIIRMRKGPNHEIWILTNTGITVLNEQLAFKNSCLSEKIVSDVVFDRMGGAWVSTVSHGVFHCRDLSEMTYYNTNIRDKEILLIDSARNGLLFAAADGGCYRIEKNNDITLIHQFERNVFCTGMYETDNAYFFTTKKGIFSLNKKTKRSTNIVNLNRMPLYSIGLALFGSDTAVALCGTGIVSITQNTTIHEIDVENKIVSFLKLDNEHLLIGSQKGLYIFNRKTYRVRGFNDFFKNMYITYLSYDTQGTLWIATKGDGVYTYSQKKQIQKLRHCPFSAVEKIIFTAPHELIFSSNQGLYSNTYRNNKITGEWKNITDYQVNDFELCNGSIWLASSRGLQTVANETGGARKYFPVIVRSVYSAGEKIPITSNLQLPGGNDIRFNFDFLNYKWPVKNFYFQLSGPTQLKGSISGNALLIQNLSPGTYQLKVYPMQGSMYHKTHFIQLSFNIVPTLWQTLWFKFLLVMVLVVLTAAIVAWYFNQKRKREQRKAQVRRTLAEHRLTALKAQINPHFISNSLSAIQSIIEKGHIDEANQYLARFSLLIRYVLKYSDKNIIHLREELNIIDLTIDLERLRFSQYFLFNKEIDPGVDIDHIYIPPLITQPFIENAIWHGLLSLKDKRIPQLLLRITRTQGNLIISIEDNGVGRKHAAAANSVSNNSVRESQGTQLIEKRMEHLNQLYEMRTSRIEITDLIAPDGTAAGTRVDIILPEELLNYLENRKYESTIG